MIDLNFKIQMTVAYISRKKNQSLLLSKYYCENARNIFICYNIEINTEW